MAQYRLVLGKGIVSMSGKLIVMTFVLLANFGMAAAQEYSVRVTNKTNLRATYSTRSRIVETVPSGTTLQVVSAFNRWLQINRNGNDVWMADWVAHTRVEGGQQTQSQTQTSPQIDNCCFVDRQCTTNQEWTDGYWAFQNGQCTAPTQVQTSTATQPTSGEPSQVNNCCFAGWNCTTDDDWVAGFHGYQTNQCKHPGIVIEGSPGFVLQMQNALDMLKERSSHWYDYVIRGLDRIRQAPPEVIGVHVTGRDFELEYGDERPPGVSYDSHTTHDAAMLVHEACHVHRYEARLEAGGLPGETACVETELQALQAINPRSHWIQYSLGVLSNIHRPECQWWWGEYRACG